MKLTRTFLLGLLAISSIVIVPALAQADLRLGLVEVKGMVCSA